MRNIALFCIFLALFMFCLPCRASGEDGDPGVERLVCFLEERYRDTRDITADFRQETFPAGATEGLVATGRVYFKRPELMRWEYTTPEEQLIVTSGQEVHVYEPEAEQVMVLPREQFFSTEVSRAFFFGEGEIERYFEIEAASEDWPDRQWTLLLLPKEPVPQLKALWITIDPETHMVRRMLLEDQLGGIVRLHFDTIRVNSGIGSELFRFTPPGGVAVYRSEGF